jgi:NAD(P)-dependent dehydrogenase (short-subunit alcohol dehydrogenase family)
MSESMQNKLAVLTGAASGIGAEVARQIAAAGGRPVILDVDAARGEPLAAELGGRFIRCNVADRDDWLAAVRTLVDAGDVPDYAHLNAGVMSQRADEPFMAIEDLPLANYRRILGVNLDGVVFGLQALLPHMRRRGGAICVTASLVGLVPLPIDPMYSTTKHALIGLVRSVAAANEDPRLRINAICPGGVDTPIVPAALRAGGMGMMSTSTLAAEVLDLLASGANGEVRVRLGEDSPATAVPVPEFG